MARAERPLRLFVGVLPPAHVAVQLAAAALAHSPPAGEPVEPEQIHLTVHHVGPTARKDTASIVESVTRAASGLRPFDLTPLRVVTIPREGPARLIAAETDEPPSLVELQRRCAVRFARRARPTPGDRFMPRLPLVRFAPALREFELDAAVDAGSFTVERVLLLAPTVRAGRPAIRVVGEAPLTG